MIYQGYVGAPALKRSGKDEPAALLADIVEWLNGPPVRKAEMNDSFAVRWYDSPPCSSEEKDTAGMKRDSL